MDKTKFIHSLKVPRMYKAASKILKEVREKNESLKYLVFQQRKNYIKPLYALILNALKKWQDLERLLRKSKILEEQSGLDPYLAKILMTELLWRKKQLSDPSKPTQIILSYKDKFDSCLSSKKKSNDDKIIEKANLKPRYVRVNTLLITVCEVVDGFRDEGWTLIRFTDPSNYQEFVTRISDLKEGEFAVDIHIEEMLIFPPNTEFHDHNAYKNGWIVLQDKASCLPVFLLDPPPGGVVLDMCAAPGMKTTLIASRMRNEGKIYAVDMDEKRVHVLKNQLKLCGVKCATAICSDVLRLTDKECPDVEYVLVDPSCSGSGIVKRSDLNFDLNKNFDERVAKLAGFQIKILKHAFRFPKARRVVYSTCSTDARENEAIVREVLSNCPAFKLLPAGDLFKANCFNHGDEKTYGEIGKRCVYTKYDHDLTNGFFIAVFERVKDGEINEFYNKNKETYAKSSKVGEKRKRCDDHDQVDVEQKKLKLNDDDEDVKKFNSNRKVNVTQPVSLLKKTKPKKKKKNRNKKNVDNTNEESLNTETDAKKKIDKTANNADVVNNKKLQKKKQKGEEKSKEMAVVDEDDNKIKKDIKNVKQKVNSEIQSNKYEHIKNTFDEKKIKRKKIKDRDEAENDFIHVREEEKSKKKKIRAGEIETQQIERAEDATGDPIEEKTTKKRKNKSESENALESNKGRKEKDENQIINLEDENQKKKKGKKRKNDEFDMNEKSVGKNQIVNLEDEEQKKKKDKKRKKEELETNEKNVDENQVTNLEVKNQSRKKHKNRKSKELDTMNEKNMEENKIIYIEEGNQKRKKDKKRKEQFDMNENSVDEIQIINLEDENQKRKKDKKRKNEQLDMKEKNVDENQIIILEDENQKIKKDKKRKNKELNMKEKNVDNNQIIILDDENQKKKKDKKRKNDEFDMNETIVDENQIINLEDENQKRKKDKRKKEEVDANKKSLDENQVINLEEENHSRKKHKKRKSEELDINEKNVEKNEIINIEKEKQKRKKDKEEFCKEHEVTEVSEKMLKKKRKNKSELEQH